MDFGVVDDVDGVVTRFREKPTLSNCVSMGAYCMEPDVLRYIPSGMPFGFDDLVFCMMERGVPVHIYKHQGLWLDIGRVEDFHKAQDMIGRTSSIARGGRGLRSRHNIKHN